jgi:hypothetical protein
MVSFGLVVLFLTNSPGILRRLKSFVRDDDDDATEGATLFPL